LHWAGDGCVRVLESDLVLGALLLERCEPGAHLRALPEPEQDAVIASLLLRLWRSPPAEHPFRPLSTMIAFFAVDALARQEFWADPALVRDGLWLMEELSRPAPSDVLLLTDLHAGNVLRAEREPWLAIDPKPFVGDRTYDATQHLLNCRERLRSDGAATIHE